MSRTVAHQRHAARALAAFGILAVVSGCKKTYSLDSSSVIDSYKRCAPCMLVGHMKNASGIAFNPDSRSLFIINDSPTLINETDCEGKVLRTIRLDHAFDLEGIAYLGADRFAIVDEGTSTIHFLTLTAGTESVDLSTTDKIRLDIPRNNNGLEGIAYDRAEGCFYVIKERRPKRILRIDMGSEEVSTPWDLGKLNVGDVSDIFFDQQTEHLMILSHEGKCIVECGRHGREYGRLSLAKGQAGMETGFRKPEGLSLDPQTRRLFVCGEGNDLCIYGPREQQATQPRLARR